MMENSGCLLAKMIKRRQYLIHTDYKKKIKNWKIPLKLIVL